MPDVILKAPRECSADEVKAFVDLVATGDEVIDGLRERVRENGWVLGFVKDGLAMVAAGAIKTPAASYWERVFKKAGVSHERANYPKEIGWILVHESYRKRGLGESVVNALLQFADSRGQKVFATCRADNEDIQKLLQKFAFVPLGKDYASSRQDTTRQAGYLLRLLIRNAGAGAQIGGSSTPD